MASETQQSSSAVAKPSVLEKFLAVRNVPPPPTSSSCSSPKRAATSNSAASAASARSVTVRGARASAAPPPAVWKRFTKRAHGERVAAVRAAMRTPDDGYRDSRDAYNPKKPPRRFVQLHVEEEAVSTDFHVHTRAMFFEREKVDRDDVCDLLANRQLYDARMLELYSHDDDGE